MHTYLREFIELEDLGNKDVLVLAHHGHAHHELQQVQDFLDVVVFHCAREVW